MRHKWIKSSLARSPRPAPSGAGLWSSLGCLEPGTDLFGLLDILVRGAPENDASGHTPDRDKDVELCGHAEDAGFHGRDARALRNHQAGGGVVQRLDFPHSIGFSGGLMGLRQ
jgi:hypothetical protein